MSGDEGVDPEVVSNGREEVQEEECKEVIVNRRRRSKPSACTEEMNDRANKQNAVIQPLLTGKIRWFFCRIIWN